uniref:AT-rich interactive domain-containing protein 5 n=1 Tax=Rhizophora mucronata TaxID=61149 RepID=A0A2P2KFQ1_RHIMU
MPGTTKCFNLQFSAVLKLASQCHNINLVLRYEYCYEKQNP